MWQNKLIANGTVLTSHEKVLTIRIQGDMQTQLKPKEKPTVNPLLACYQMNPVRRSDHSSRRYYKQIWRTHTVHG